MNDFLIKDIFAREVLDSRGIPTVEASVVLNGGAVGVCKVPSGASTGEYEAVELRDNDSSRYFGKGVLKAVENVNKKIKKALLSFDATKQTQLDEIMINLDGTLNKSVLGANAILSVSVATAKAVAEQMKLPLYEYFKILSNTENLFLPVPMCNILNGGKHADNSLDVQEFLIVPVGANSFSEAIRWCDEVFHSLKLILKKKGFATSVGDEGGFAPNLHSTEEALKLIILAINQSGYTTEQIKIALDSASSGWFKAKDKYFLPKQKLSFSTESLVSYWQELVKKYPIISLEDPFDENDWKGFKLLTEKIGDKVQIVGDDLFVTNSVKLQRGIDEKSANAILIKLNQIGTVTETIKTVKLAQQKGWETIISHRSGETEDTTIADLVVGLGSKQIKTGSLSRSERIAKYNRLLKIELELGKKAKFAGITTFNH